MSTNDASVEELMAAIEKIKRDAYSRGWQDAIEHIYKAAARESGVTAPPANPDKADQPPSPRRSKRAQYGIVPKLTVETLESSRENGATITEIQDRATSLGHDVAKASIRSTLRRMLKEDKIRQIGNRWVIVQRSVDQLGPQHGDKNNAAA